MTDQVSYPYKTSKIYHDTAFNDPTLNDASVASTSKFRMFMFLGN
jgi:hypothetical protein